MPLCAAIGCSNRREKGFLMKSFPRNKERRAIWAAQVNRAAWAPGDRSCLCQIHFDSSMWIPGTNKLIPNAVPTLFMRQLKNCRSSSKKYFEEAADENLNDEEETLIWVSSPRGNNQDPLALTDDNQLENNRLPEEQQEPLVLCREELEVWTEDCITGAQRIENYKSLEKLYEASEKLSNEVTNGEVSQRDGDVTEVSCCLPEEVLIEDASSLKNIERKTIASPELRNPLSNFHNGVIAEETIDLTETCHRPMETLPQDDAENREI